MQKLIQLCLVLSLFTLTASLTACSSLRFPGVFRIDIGQGNIITEGSREKLKLGMTPNQVEYVLGSPAIQDPMNPGRWDYVYSYQSGKGGYVENRLTLYFDQGGLRKIDDSEFRNPKEVTEDLVQQIAKSNGLTNITTTAEKSTDATGESKHTKPRRRSPKAR